MAQNIHRQPSLEPTSTLQVRRLDETVFPITEVKLGGVGATGKFGTAFCLDPQCRFVVTNYHVAILTKPRKIRGQRVVHRYLATGPHDEGASLNDGESVSPMKFTLSRDLAVFELRHPLRNHHGVPFSMAELPIGRRVDIYSYPKEGISPFRKLLTFHATFKGETSTGLLAFDYEFSTGRAIRPGSSGGIVVDSENQCIVGVLNGIGRNEEAVALAVPVGSLAEFVNRIEPVMGESLFPPDKSSISPMLTDFHSKLAPLARSHFRLAESAEIQLLRTKAQMLADGMRNFIAVQTFEWGSGTSLPADRGAYEIQVIDGHQKFRKYPDGKKQLARVPYPSVHTAAIVPAIEWSELPELVGKKLHLQIREAEDATIDGKQIKVFQYQADVEDSACMFLFDVDFGILRLQKIATVSCYGEVWTDENFNILRISEHDELIGKWADYVGIMTYGWLKRSGDPPQLIPLTFSTQVKYGSAIYWCRGTFGKYRVFSSSVIITPH